MEHGSFQGGSSFPGPLRAGPLEIHFPWQRLRCQESPVSRVTVMVSTETVGLLGAFTPRGQYLDSVPTAPAPRGAAAGRPEPLTVRELQMGPSSHSAELPRETRGPWVVWVTQSCYLSHWHCLRFVVNPADSSRGSRALSVSLGPGPACWGRSSAVLLLARRLCGPWPLRAVWASASTGFPEPDAMSGAHLAPASVCQT